MFRYRHFDPKRVFRLIMNSQTYQRDIRTIDSQKQLLAAVRPSRIRSDQVVAAVQLITGANRGVSRGLVVRIWEDRHVAACS